MEQKLQRTGSFSGQEALANWKLQRAGSFSGLRELLEEESVQVPLEDDILDILEDQPEVSNEHQVSLLASIKEDSLHHSLGRKCSYSVSG